MRITRFSRFASRLAANPVNKVRYAANAAILAGGMMFWGPARAEVIFYEDFDNLVLKPIDVDPDNPAQSLSRAGENLGDGIEVWTNVPPTGWVADNSRTPDASKLYPVSPDDADPRADEGSARHTDFRPGGLEFYGFTFVDKQWWVATEGDQERSKFVGGFGNVMVADPDAYDDNGSYLLNPAGCQLCGTPGIFDVAMTTPAISLDGYDRKSVKLTMNSSFRPYDFMTALVDVSFDGGEWSNILKYDTANSGGNSALDRIDETVELPISAPNNAKAMSIRFGMKDAGNDWWWAVDNIEITANKGATASPYDFNGDGGVDAADAGIMFADWGGPGSTSQADKNQDGYVDAADAGAMFADWTGDPATPADKAATAEYNFETGELKISSAGSVNVFVQSASNGITPLNPAPAVPVGLLTNNTGRVGLTNLGPINVTNFSFGNIGKGLAMSDLKLVYTTALGTKGIEVPAQASDTAAFKYIPEPASLGMIGLGLLGMLASRRRVQG